MLRYPSASLELILFVVYMDDEWRGTAVTMRKKMVNGVGSPTKNILKTTDTHMSI